MNGTISRTWETQEKNLRVARSYVSDRVTLAIRKSHYCREDKETMARIINATYRKDALERYKNADTMVREALQDIIEEVYYGTMPGQRRCPVCGGIYTERPALSRKDGETDICPECGMREALEAYQQGGAAQER